MNKQSLIIKSVWIMLCVHGLSGMNSELNWDDRAFRDALSDDEDSIDLHEISSLSTHHPDVDFIVYDSKGTLRGISASRTHVVQLDDTTDLGELCYLKSGYDPDRDRRRLTVMKIVEGNSFEAKAIFETIENRIHVDDVPVSLSDDGKMLVVASSDERGFIKIHDIEKKSVMRKRCPNDVQEIVLSPDKKKIAALSEDCEFRLFDLQDDFATVFYLDDYSLVLKFSHDSEYVFACLGVYSVKEKKLLWKTIPNGNPLNCASFNRDDTLLAIGQHGVTTVFDARDGVRLYEIWSGSDQVLFSSDNKHLVTADCYGACIWQLALLKKLYDAFSQEARDRLNQQLDHGKVPAELQILDKIDLAMRRGVPVDNNGYNKKCFDRLPKSLQDAFRKYIGNEQLMLSDDNAEESM